MRRARRCLLHKVLVRVDCEMLRLGLMWSCLLMLLLLLLVMMMMMMMLGILRVVKAVHPLVSRLLNILVLLVSILMVMSLLMRLLGMARSHNVSILSGQ